MADFGKLNFSTSFNRTSAFPLDAACYFNSLALAKAAAATAEEVGSTNTVYYYGQKLMVDLLDGTTPKWYTIQSNGTLLEDGTESTANEGTSFETGENLELIDGVLKVKVATAVEANNTLPVTSAAVHTHVGNIEALLETI